MKRETVGIWGALSAGWVVWWAVTAGAATPPAALESIPGTVNYQATLKHANGSNYTDGVYDIEFRLYPASSGGLETALWGAKYSVYVKDAQFGVMLGSVGGTAVTPSPTNAPTELWKALWYDEALPLSRMYIGMRVLPATAESIPRQEFLCTPFACRANQAIYARRSIGDFDAPGLCTVNTLKVTNSLTVSGSVAVGGALTGTNGMAISGGAAVNGQLLARSGLVVTGATTVSGALTVTNGLTTLGTTAINGALTVTSGLTTLGATVIGGSLTGTGTGLSGVAKLTGGNTFTGSQTVDGRSVPVTDGDLRIVRGNVDSGWNITTTGSGFTVTSYSTGTDDPGVVITFNPPFSGVPSVSVLPRSCGNWEMPTVGITALSASEARFYFWTDTRPMPGFSLIAIGPR